MRRRTIARFGLLPDRRSVGVSRIWMPRLQTNVTSPTQVFATHEAIFPGLPNTFAEFKRLVGSLSRTDTIVWCGRLNLYLGFLTAQNSREVQKALVPPFFEQDAIDRLNRFMREHGPDSAVFFRGQLIELMRWSALLACDHSNDGNTFEDRFVRQCFARAALLASDVWSRRVYPDALQLVGTVESTRRRVLAEFRRSSIEVSSGSNPLHTLARGYILATHLRRRLPEADAVFGEKTGLTLADYFAALASLTVLGLKHTVATPTDKAHTGILRTGDLDLETGTMAQCIRAYLALESQTIDELRDALWGARRKDSDESGASSLPLKAIRMKPLLDIGLERVLILDPSFFAERAIAGPLFHIVSGRSEKDANLLFGAFGNAFEDYTADIMNRMFGVRANSRLVQRFVAAPKDRSNPSEEVELSDGILFDHTAAAFFEVKAVWIREDLSAPDTAPAKYVAHLRDRYSVARKAKRGESRVKGVGQLARTIKSLPSGASWFVDLGLDDCRRFLPVLLVNDVHLNAPAHCRFLAEEFVEAVTGQTTWEPIALGSLQIDHLIVLTIDDLELLETSSENFSVLDCLKAYSDACPDRMTSFFNFLVTSRFRESLRINARLEAQASLLMDRAIARFSPSGR